MNKHEELEIEIEPEDAASGSVVVPIDYIVQELRERGWLVYSCIEHLLDDNPQLIDTDNLPSH